MALSAHLPLRGQVAPALQQEPETPGAGEPPVQDPADAERLGQDLPQQVGQNQQYPALGNLFGVPRRALQADRALVVRFAQAESKEESTLEDDLAVMSHLLRKVLAEKGGSPHNNRNVLGVDVAFAPGSQPIRTVYLEGYGALFLLNVEFPLHPSPRPPGAQKEGKQTDSAWEQAKREYYGEPAADKTLATFVEAYDERKVSALKEGLFEALKSAANIRGLKFNESIIVCVAGGGTTRAVPSRGMDGAGRFVFSVPYTSPDAVTQGSFLTLRAKKTDIDAFASGKITPEEFSKAATVATYLGRAGGWSGPGIGYSAYPGARPWQSNAP